MSEQVTFNSTEEAFEHLLQRTDIARNKRNQWNYRLKNNKLPKEAQAKLLMKYGYAIKTEEWQLQ